MRANHLILTLILLFSLQACNSRQAGEASYDTSAPEAKMAEMPATEEEGGETRLLTRQEGPVEQLTTKKLIRTADVRMEVEDYSKARENIGALIQRWEAYIVTEEEQNLNYQKEDRLVIRLLPERLDSFLTEVEKLAFNVDYKNVSARDVTREYVDLETRLNAKRAVVERYREILKSARTVEDILAVENNLRQVIEEIESVEGQLRYLRDQVQYSTVNLTFYRRFDQPEVRQKSFWRRLGIALSDGWDVLINLTLGLFSIWPIILLLAALGYWLNRGWKKRKKG